jgi:uncharacterized protein (DUF433 family)/predicted RNase H-like HicB family nuclease
MQVYIPIVVYKLSSDKKWTADALGLEGAVTDGDTQNEARANLDSVLSTYVSMLDAGNPLEAAQLDYISKLTEPPEGVDWIACTLVTATGVREQRAQFEHVASGKQRDAEGDAGFEVIVSQLRALSDAVKTLTLQISKMTIAGGNRGIERTPDVVGGDACIVRTRIPIWVLANYRRMGWSEALILENFPTLRAMDLVNAWEYIESHEDEIEQTILMHEEA